MIWSLRMRKAQYLKVEVFSLFSRLFPLSPLHLCFSFSSYSASFARSFFPLHLLLPHFHSSLPTCIPYVFLSSLPASFRLSKPSSLPSFLPPCSFPLPKPSSLPCFLPPCFPHLPHAFFPPCFLPSSQAFLTAFLPPSLFLSSSQVFLTALFTPSFLSLLPPFLFPSPVPLP